MQPSILVVCLTAFLATANLPGKGCDNRIRHRGYLRRHVRLLSGEPYIPSLYVSWSLSERLSLGPQLSLGRVSDDGFSFTAFHLGGRGAFHLRSNTMSGADILGHGGLATVTGDDGSESESETDFAAGAGLGYQ